MPSPVLVAEGAVSGSHEFSERNPTEKVDSTSGKF